MSTRRSDGQLHGISGVADIIKRRAPDPVNRVKGIGRSFNNDGVTPVDRHAAGGGMRRDGDVIADQVHVVFQVAAKVGDQLSAAPEMGLIRARAGAEDTHIMGDIGIGADGVDEDRLDDVLAGISKDVEGEFVIGSAPLAEIDWLASGDFEDMEVVGRRVAVGILHRCG